ncbi:MAG TPA: IS110 family transposase [Gemmataceae bacterium]|nr:IS110 family transposase [Gemmataceae bacterium]
MDILHPHCAGLDVHKETVVACVRHCTPAGKVTQQTRTFPTHTAALLSLLDWLRAEGVSHAAMESTGVYWKPVFHLLEGHLEVLLVNARHVKQVPGRKTDVKDAAWLAELLQHGLLKASFVPPAPIRELRDLTRQRTRLAEEKAAAANRIQKVLEDANLKLASVATDILGESGRDMLRALIAGETDPAELAGLARGKLRAKIPQLRLALRGCVTGHHRFLLQVYLEHVNHLEGLMGRLSERIEEVLAPFAEAVERLKTIPGVSTRLAEVLVAEVGTDMSRFPTAGHLASWAGMCPGNDQSAGKRRSGRTPPGNRWLKQGLVQAAWAASHTKETYLSAQYHRLAKRRGRKRAVVALGHTLLVIVYHVLRRGVEYRELGAGYLDGLASDRLTQQLVRRLEKLGHKVTLEPCAVA